MLLGVTRRIAVGRALAVTAALLATVTATGAAGASQSHRSAAPQHRHIGWTLIAVKRIGGVDQWFWYAVDTCSLDITQFQAGSPVRNVDSIKVSLLATPALGCTKPFSEHWKP
jgi:hypothetical protein